MQCSLGQKDDSGTCTDTATQFDSWEAALGEAAGYADAGWRLPNIKELSSLIDTSHRDLSPRVNQSVFANNTVVTASYWSSTPSNYKSSSTNNYPYSLAVDFGDGSFKNVHRDGSDNSAKYVRLVKSLRD